VAGEFELVVSEALLAALARALAYPKIRTRIARDEARAFVELLRHTARPESDPEAPAPRSADPGDDYLLALAEAKRAVLVSGDQHLLALADELPIFTPRAFLDALAQP
jgi:predicted nucleic acid-binding protein